MNKIINTRCAGCGHRRPISDSNKDSYRVCLYILDTGYSRDCKVDECTHFTTDKCHILSDEELIKRASYPNI